MSVKANKCVYYKLTDNINDTCTRYDEHCSCCILLGDNCKMYYPKYKYQHDTKINYRIEINEAREILAKYKEINNLSLLNLGIKIGTSYSTVKNFLNGSKLKQTSYYKINKFIIKEVK